ncbi:LOW QUALITY PROTEIN: F-box domain containing protein [Trema orientale]|uniref:F-box domain containing protein n=1 Tax=Trema orientale TaxID=63057 RepID=A0A2P5CIB5_TREOI|nr:LOW QUALITY PROTEIN: F-box domain containing protein [Trema orientale]
MTCLSYNLTFYVAHVKTVSFCWNLSRNGESLCHFPKEVMMEEIMSRVPADSLVQFKCVNKLWYALISALINGPAFVAKQLHNSKNKSSPLYSPSPSVDHRLITLPLLTLFNYVDDNNRYISVKEDLNVPHLQNENFGANWSKEFSQNQRMLERMRIPVREFGYDSRAKDYKLVAIWRLPIGVAKVEVYTLRSGSWREINISLDSSENIKGYAHLDGLSWRGVCYWILQSFSDDNVILCFNICDEDFHIIPLPNLEDISRFICVFQRE